MCGIARTSARADLAPARVEPAILRAAAASPRQTVVAWVYFADRAGAERDPRAILANAQVSRRCLERRMIRGTIQGVDASDLPVHPPYLQALVARGARVRGTSRWLNAASVEIPAGLALELARLPFVTRIERVPTGTPIRPVDEPALARPWRAPAPARAAATAFAPGDTAYYGMSFRQLAMMQVPQLHKAGLTGHGVLICMIDAGFRTKHEAFANLQVLARRDFIYGDTTVDDQQGQDTTGQASHGTMTLGCVAASKPGVYSGVAPGVTVALAKTEWVPSEHRVEMDRWQFAAEWADSLGADVISSSLGYSEFDHPDSSYTYADMDGRTTVVARAALEAARRGIVVVNAAGNEGATPWKKIISPGDADSIITVGAVNSNNDVAYFSSQGPTSDGRIKPDVTAMGQSVEVLSFTDSTAYQSGSGTSFSTPLTAGVVALLLEAHPQWSPYAVREALRSTALNHAAPDTVIGWGLVQGAGANAWHPAVGVPPTPPLSRASLAIGPNPLRRGAELGVRFMAPTGSRVTLDVVDLAGRRRATLFAGRGAGEQNARWSGRDREGRPLPAGIYWIRLSDGGSAPRAVRVALIP